MDINLFATIITIIAGLLTILQIINGFTKPNPTEKVQQINKYGNNYYTDNSTTIKKNTTINNPSSTYNSNNDGLENAGFIAAIGIIFTAILLALYSLIYESIAVISLLLLSVTLYRDSKSHFENNNAKIHWAFQRLTLIFLIIMLSFIPKSVLDVINQLQAFRFDSLNSVLNTITYNIHFIWNLYNDSILLTLNLIGRILVTFGLLYFLTVSSIRKKVTHNTYGIKDSFTFFLITLLIIFGSNIEFYWNFADPIRHNLELWINSSSQQTH